MPDIKTTSIAFFVMMLFVTTVTATSTKWSLISAATPFPARRSTSVNMCITASDFTGSTTVSPDAGGIDCTTLEQPFSPEQVQFFANGMDRLPNRTYLCPRHHMVQWQCKYVYPSVALWTQLLWRISRQSQICPTCSSSALITITSAVLQDESCEVYACKGLRMQHLSMKPHIFASEFANLG